MTATDLERELARLADAFDPPAVPVSTDVARGRRRLLRTRMTVGGAVVATAAVLTSATLLGQGAPRSEPQPVDRTPDAERSDAADAAEPILATRPLPSIDDWMENGDELSRWNDVLAERLDPQREHLQPFTRRTANEQSGGDSYLGSRFGWVNPGEEGLGMLQVGIAASSRGIGSWSICGSGPDDLVCSDATGPNGERARVGQSGSVTTVEVEQTDGEVVLLTLELLFGNNSLVPISGTDITTDQLVEAAADERLDLPAPPPEASLDLDTFVAAASTVASRDRWTVDSFPLGGASFDGWVRDGNRQVAHVSADAHPTSAGYGLPRGCDEKQFRTCERREVGGQVVFVGRDDETYYPGTQVIFAGPENVVRIEWQRSGDEGADPDLEGLIGFVTDPRWQS